MTPRSRILLALGAAALLFAPAAAIASEGGGGHGGYNWKELGFAFINFAVFLGGLIYLLRKPVREFLSHRRASLADNLDEATRLKAEAQARLADLEARLANLDQERERLLAQYRDEGEREKQRLTENAQRSAAAIRREAKFLLEQHTRELRGEIRRRAVDAALALADRILREQLRADDRARLADEYIVQLREATPPSSP